MSLLALNVVSLLAFVSPTGPTSCDIVTGASCLWGEGCDCDHDGYVGDKKKVAKYCHLDKCPMDGNDFDAIVLGVPSQYNADGDGWTTAYDCDDNDPCIAGDCSNICDVAPDGGASGTTDGGATDGSATGTTDGGVEPPVAGIDNDGDKVMEEFDCNDNNPYIKPNSPFACCDCGILEDPQQKAQFQCATHPCPFGDDNAGSGTAEATSTDGGIDDENGSAGDSGEASGDGSGDPTTGDGSAGAPQVIYDSPTLNEDSPFVAAGQLEQEGPPGCQAANTPMNGHWGFGLLLVLPFAFGLIARRPSRAQAFKVGAVGLVLLLLGAGCATVKPWERETLANPCMVFGGNGYEIILEQHMLQYREGAAGGFGGGGGGCGCN